MTEKQFLHWVADRLVHVYNESPNVDFVHKLRKIADKVEEVYKVGHSHGYNKGYADGKFGLENRNNESF